MRPTPRDSTSTARGRLRATPGLLAAAGFLAALLAPALAFASGGGDIAHIDLTTHWVGFASLGIFVVAYGLVMFEEQLHLKKSIPVIIAAGHIWLLVAAQYASAGEEFHHVAEKLIRHNLLEFGELFLFLLAAMTYINTMEERSVFEWLRAWLVGRGFSLRTVFWVTGALAFVISPIADNLTTALLMGAVLASVGGGQLRFVALGCINIVVAANAGGAFSPFGDITTLMVWQKGLLEFSEFFALLLPSLVNWLVPAAILSFAIGDGKPSVDAGKVEIKDGGIIVIFLFLLTISMAVMFHSLLHLPPVIGMMTGLGILKAFGYIMQVRSARKGGAVESSNPFEAMSHEGAHSEEFDIFKRLEKAEWDTLMFFYGVIVCVGGLGTIGYLEVLSHAAYHELGNTWANVLVGVLSAIVDNIPVMFAVLTMNPPMGEFDWLLVTLTAGVGGSMLSIGSAAGVALMGQARGIYTFGVHLKWSWAIALGYAASIYVHFLVNG
jgi:Na+/H+ antiporter NhaD/arsenite permease-like protein